MNTISSLNPSEVTSQEWIDAYYSGFYHDDWDTITSEDVINDPKLHWSICLQIQMEYMRARSAQLRKRELFMEREKKLRPAVQTASTESKVRVYTFWQQLKFFIARFRETNLTPMFVGQEFLDDDFAYKLQKLAEYDCTAMCKMWKDVEWLRHIGIYGSGLRRETTWIKHAKCVNFEVVNPKYWIPDPTGTVTNWRNYMWFELMWSIREMNAINHSAWEQVFFNLDKVQQWLQTETAEARLNDDMAANNESFYERMSRCGITERRTKLGKSQKKYKVTLSNLRGLIIRVMEIDPVSNDEKEDPTLIPWDVNICTPMPMDSDPWWMSLAEMLLDFQNAQNRLLNLSLAKEERNAGYRQFLVDIDRIVNVNTLAQKNLNWPTFIPARGGANGLWGTVVPVGDDPVDSNTVALIDNLDLKAQKQTGYTEQARGLPSNKQQTLGQTNVQESNSDLLFSLDADMIAESENRFWRDIWYRGLKKYMTNYDEKRARIWNGLASSTEPLKKNELMSWRDPDIIVVSRELQLKKDKELLTYMMSREQVIMQDPNIPQIYKLFFRRDLDKLAGMPRELIMRNNSLTVDELKAKDAVLMINNNIVPKNLFSQGFDPFTYWLYISSCKKSVLKDRVLTQITNYIKNNGWQNKLSAMQQAAPTDQMQWLANSMASQQQSAVISQNKQALAPTQ